MCVGLGTTEQGQSWTNCKFIQGLRQVGSSGDLPGCLRGWRQVPGKPCFPVWSRRLLRALAPSAVSPHTKVKTLQAATLSFLHKPAQRSESSSSSVLSPPQGKKSGSWKVQSISLGRNVGGSSLWVCHRTPGQLSPLWGACQLTQCVRWETG